MKLSHWYIRSNRMEGLQQLQAWWLQRRDLRHHKVDRIKARILNKRWHRCKPPNRPQSCNSAGQYKLTIETGLSLLQYIRHTKAIQWEVKCKLKWWSKSKELKTSLELVLNWLSWKNAVRFILSMAIKNSNLSAIKSSHQLFLMNISGMIKNEPMPKLANFLSYMIVLSSLPIMKMIPTCLILMKEIPLNFHR